MRKINKLGKRAAALVLEMCIRDRTKRYGMIYVDQDDYGKGTGKRLRKKSFYYYKKLIASNGADLENDCLLYTSRCV